MKKIRELSVQSLVFNKVIFLIILLALIFAAFSAVDGADINISNSTSGGLNRTVNQSNSGDRIILDAGVYTNNVTDIIVYNKNLTIVGKDSKNTIIDARKQGRIFYTMNSVTLINLTFINGYAGSSENGGAIYNTGNLTLINCTYSNNAGYYGGAICNYGTTLTIINSNFVNNVATTGRGGAIYNDNTGMNPNNRYHTNVTIINSIFTNNTAEWGGAIYNQNWINITIELTNFINNSASNASGGAIYIGGSDRAQINNSKFENNIAVGNGGAVSFNAMYSNITNSIFINNSANIAGAVDFASAPDGSLLYCTFINNSANNYAGALRIYSNRVLVSGSRFINNSATNYGGAIYNNANNNVTINNSEFLQNKANYGGAFYNAGDAKITNSKFISNVANYGGGIYHASGHYMIVSGNTMSFNIANDLGNEIYNNGNMGILNLKYLNNSNIIVNNNSQITLYATLTDDMGNPVTGQTVSFLIDGLTVGYSTFIEGAAELTYFVNLNTENALVNGLYFGAGNNINILNGMLRITSTSEVGGNVSLNQTEYFVNDTTKGVINVINNGPNHVYNVKVKINLPSWFNINKNDIIVSQGYYDDINGIWYIGDLASTARAMMEFTGEFTQKGQGILSIDISGDNFNNSMDSFNFLVKEKTLSNGTNPGSNNNSNNGSNNGNGSGSNGSNSGNGNGSNHKENNPPDKSKDQDFDKNSYIKKGNDNNRNNNYLVVEANMKKTGVPIVAILLILLSILGLSIRRK